MLRFSHILLALAAVTLLGGCGQQAVKNGFDLSDGLIPPEKIHHGGPPRDGIPSIDNPKFITAAEAGFLKDDDRVMGVRRNGIAKAYPIRILNWHEIVNDTFGDEAVLISYCPLCYSGMAFLVQGTDFHLTFGVSGLLYNSDMLLYDRQTGSLWSQIKARAISGPLKGTVLPLLPSSHTTWRDWKSEYPDTLVLSTDTGFNRNYNRSPYLGYGQSNQLFFPVEHQNSQYRRKDLVLGVTIGDKQKAYPFPELEKQGLLQFEDEFAGEKLRIEWKPAENTARILDQDNNELPSLIAYWFAWHAFYP